MLTPSKHESLDQNLLVIGGHILTMFKKKLSWNIEDLFQILNKNNTINLNQYYNCLTFLWLSEILYIDEYSISLKKNNVIK